MFWLSQCKSSNSLYNCGLYEFKQRHYQQLEAAKASSTYWRGDEYRHSWKLRRIKATNCNEVDKILKPLEHYKVMAAQSAQHTLKVLQRDINSYNQLVDKFFRGEVDRPRIPRYRKSGGLFNVIFPSQALTYRNGFVYPSISKLSKPELLCEIKLEVPEFIDINLLREIRIRPSRNEFWIDWICDDSKQPIKDSPNLDYNQAIAIDHGVKCWLSAVTTKGKSFIVEAPQLKTAIWKYQTKVKQYKQGKSNFYWDDYLDKLTSKYNLQVRDAVNKAARFVINRCLRSGIGNLVIGWNKGNKQNINLGRKNNYEVVNMPTARLIKRLEELCSEYGIKFIVTTEEYRSKASFVDDDELHQYGAKPAEWKPSGERITRDEYRTKDGRIIHADLNGAGNILRKVFDQVFDHRFYGRIRLEIIKRDALTRPKRYDVFNNLKKKYRKQTLRSPARVRLSASLDHVVTSA